jgi:hypothetical protein
MACRAQGSDYTKPIMYLIVLLLAVLLGKTLSQDDASLRDVDHRRNYFYIGGEYRNITVRVLRLSSAILRSNHCNRMETQHRST